MKRRGAERKALRRRAILALEQILDSERLASDLKIQDELSKQSYTWDLVVTIPFGEGTIRLGIEVSAIGEPGRALKTLGTFAVHEPKDPETCPLLFAPYVSERTADLCQRAGFGYFDELGNCRIEAQGILISKRVAAAPPRVARAARSLFAPRSSRITRVFLSGPDRTWTQAELAEEAEVSLGLVNRVVRRLMEERYIRKAPDGLQLAEREALLERWKQGYSIDQSKRVECYTSLPLETIEERLEKASKTLPFIYALTLLSAARRRVPFTRANRVHAYIQAEDLDSLLSVLELKRVSSGGNVVLLLPYDAGVFYKSIREMGVSLVSDVQLYLDLQSSGGRAQEQAEALARQHLGLGARKRSPASEARAHEFLNLRSKGISFEQEGEFRAASKAYSEALEKARESYLSGSDESVLSVRIKLWLSLLDAAYEDRDRSLLKKARKIFSSDEELIAAGNSARYSTGRLQYGRLLQAGLSALWTTSEKRRQKFMRDLDDLFIVVSSPFTEISQATRDRAAIVYEHIGEQLADKGK